MKTLLALALSLLIIIAQSIWLYQQHQTLHQSQNKLKAEQKAHQQTRAAHQAYRRAAEQLQTRLDQNQRSHTEKTAHLSQALNKQSQWANTPLPEDLRNILNPPPEPPQTP